MKNSFRFSTLCLSLFLLVATGCGPNGDKNSMDTSNSNGEGAVDSTRLTHMDSSSISHQEKDSTEVKGY